MDSTILNRLLDPVLLGEQVAQRLSLDGVQLLTATPRDIDAPGYLSDLVGITMTWSSSTSAPTTAVLKLSHVDFGKPELPFYENVAKGLNCPVIPGFYGGGVDEPTGRTWLLMEDLSGTHERPSVAPIPPTFARSVQIVEGLARFHAAGWSRDWSDSGQTLWERLRSSHWLETACERLFIQAGDALDEGTRDAYTRFLLKYPALVERAEELRGRTLVHGDAHVWNWMLPRNDAEDSPKLLDWDAWHPGAGVWDLAYMMAVQLDVGARKRFEHRLLDRYHSALAAAGVTEYTREALQEDYRLAVLLHMRTPIARFARTMSAYVWWPQLTRVQHAVQDLRCLELLS